MISAFIAFGIVLCGAIAAAFLLIYGYLIICTEPGDARGFYEMFALVAAVIEIVLIMVLRWFMKTSPRRLKSSWQLVLSAFTFLALATTALWYWGETLRWW